MITANNRHTFAYCMWCLREREGQHSINLGLLAPLLLSNAHSLSHPHPACGVCERERDSTL